MPEVSVVIPTRDRWPRLERTLSSALDQREVDHEVLVVDDGSADDGALDALLERRADSRLRGIRLGRSRGAAAARNAGVADARGDWVAFLDDDDLWAPEKLWRQLAAGEDGAGLVYSSAVTVDNEDRVVRVLPAPDPATLGDRLLTANVIPAGSSNVMARRDPLLALGGFDESFRFLPDWDMWIRLVASTRPAVDPSISVAYVLHSDNSALMHLDGLRGEIAALAIKHRCLPDPVQVTRWIAASQRQARQHGRASRQLLSVGLRHRDPGSLMRAAHAALRLPDHRQAEYVPEASWVVQAGRAASGSCDRSPETVSAIVVAYKTPAELAAAIASLHAQSSPPDEIVVIDNGASESEPVVHRPGEDRFRLERAPANLGFGAGCNMGARLAGGDALLILNADVVLTGGALGVMRARLQSDPRIGVVGPRILSRGELQLSARAFPDLRTGVFGRRSPLTRLLIRARRYPAEFRPAFGPGGEVDWVSGACMLVRREAFDSVGGFDSDYWMYWEDADLCRRLCDRGWRIFYEPGGVVHHATGASGTNERTIRAFHDSAALFASRHVVRSAPARRGVRLILKWRCRTALHAYERTSRRR